MNRFIFILIVIFILFCKNDSNDYLYASSITGAPFLKEKRLGTEYKNKIPFGAKLENLGITGGVHDKNGWSLYYKVKYKNNIGWINHEHIEHEQPKYYYRVIARSGLNLREKPNIKSARLIILPYSHIGEILEPSQSVEIIDKRKGYWFKTTYKNNTGWIFSGYTVGSQSIIELEREKENKLDIFIDDIPVYKKSEKHLTGAGITKNIYETDRFSGFSVEYKIPKDDCDGPASRIYFKEKSSGTLFATNEFYSETVSKYEPPFPEAFITNVQFCNCCCPSFGSFLYIETKSGIKKLTFEMAGDAQCFDGDPFSYASTNKKIPSERRLLVYWKKPECKVPVGNKSPETGGQILHYSHDFFAIIELSNELNLSVEKYQDSGIPEKYIDLWTKADTL